MKLGTNDIGSVYLGTNAVSSVYLGSNLVWSGMDADYKAILDYATAQGYTLPSSGQQTLQNQLVVDLKNGGIWAKLDTFAVFATDGDSDFALIDWKRLSDYTAINSPTFTTNQGFQGDGISAYIDSNFNPSTSGVNYTLNSASFGSLIRTFGITGINGSVLNGDGIPLWFRFTDSRLYVNSSGFIGSVTTPANKSLVVGNRPNFGLQEYYLNGAFISNDSDISTAIPTNSLRALRQSTTYSNSQISFSFAGGSLNSTEQAALYSSLNTYLGGLIGW
jgi:hypothetical protein